MHQLRFSHGLSSFLERHPNRLCADRLNDLTFHQLIRQQLERPSSTTVRRLPAGHSYQTGFTLPIQYLLTTTQLSIPTCPTVDVVGAWGVGYGAPPSDYPQPSATRGADPERSPPWMRSSHCQAGGHIPRCRRGRRTPPIPESRRISSQQVSTQSDDPFLRDAIVLEGRSDASPLGVRIPTQGSA